MLEDVLREARQVMAETQRMATLDLSSEIRIRVERGQSIEDACGEGLKAVWARRGIDTPESGWDPSA